jgi:hypothetical protein
MQKPLYIFDFDDTLALSDAVVIVTHEDGIIEELSSAEYATYQERKGDQFNFEQFHSYPPNGRIVQETFVELEKALASSPMTDVVILTAREYCEPIIKFLKDMGISKLPTMECVGGADPAHKGSYVASRIKNDGYTEVHVFEDSTDNLIAIENAVNQFKDVAYYPTHVQVHEKQNEVLLRRFVRNVLLESLEK